MFCIYTSSLRSLLVFSLPLTPPWLLQFLLFGPLLHVLLDEIVEALQVPVVFVVLGTVLLPRGEELESRIAGDLKKGLVQEI